MIRECKQRAKAALGGKIFGNVWLYAVLAAILYAAIEAGAGTVIPGLGIFWVIAWANAATAEFYEALSSEPQVLPDWEVR